MSRADRLQAYIDAAAVAPELGADDCWPWVGGWIGRETGVALQMPAYRTRDEARALLERLGNMVAFAGELVRPAGLWPAHDRDLALGDVAILRLSAGPVPAIFCRAGIFAIRGEKRGVLLLRSHHIAGAWALPLEQN